MREGKIELISSVAQIRRLTLRKSSCNEKHVVQFLKYSDVALKGWQYNLLKEQNIKV